jgi:mRNA interferase MazF
MTELRRGDVVDVDLEPVRGSETGKVRPAVVVTNNTYNARVPVIQIVPITGWNPKKEKILTNVVLEPSKANGLTKVSIADCLQTRPVDQRYRVKKVRGKLNTETMEAINQAIAIVFEL